MIRMSNYSNFVAAGSPSWKLGQSPNWRGGAFDGWRHVKSTFAMDFRCDQAVCDAKNTLAEAGIDVSRASPRILENSRGLFQTFNANELARLEGVGAFVGGEFINKIRNPRGEGGVVGTVGIANKCTGYNADPNGALTNLTKLGDGAASLTEVDGRAQLEVAVATHPEIGALLDNSVLSGTVFRLNNIAGTGNAWIISAGYTGNTNPHSLSAYVFGSGNCYLKLDGEALPSATVLTSGLSRIKRENRTPANALQRLALVAAPGADLYFILFDMIEAPAVAPVPTVVAGAAATGSLPTYWNWQDGSSGLRSSFLGTGVEDGLPYADVRVSGTSSIASETATRMEFDNSTNAAAAAGQGWGLDFRVKLLSGTAPSTFARVVEYATSSSQIGAANGNTLVLDSSIQRTVGSFVVSGSSTNNVRSHCGFGIESTAYDFTIRIYAPKLVRVNVFRGSELNPDVGFEAPGDWSLSNCAVSAGALTFDDAGVLMFGSRSVFSSLTVGAVYEATLDLTATSGAGVSAYVGGTQGDTFNTTGSRISYIATAASNQVIGIISRGDNNFIGKVDNFSIKRVMPGYMPDFPILPPKGFMTESSCAADIVTAAVPGWTAGFDPAVGVSALVAVNFSHVADRAVRALLEISDGTEENSINAYINSDDQPALQIISDGILQTIATLPFPIATGLSFLTFGWSAEGGYIADQSGNVVTFDAINLPFGLCRQQLGGDSASNFLNDILVQAQTSSLLSMDEIGAWMEYEGA